MKSRTRRSTGSWPCSGKVCRVAYENNKLVRLPVIHKLKEAASRQGFFEYDAYERVRSQLRPDLRCAAAIEFELGWRAQSEVLTLERRLVNLGAGTIRLDVGSTKNDDGREVSLSPDLQAEIAAQFRPRLVAGHLHRNTLRDPGVDQVPHRPPPEVVPQHPGAPRPIARVPPRRLEVSEPVAPEAPA